MAKKRVLVVDDEHEILTLLQVRLEREGYEVRAFEGGEEALAAVHGPAEAGEETAGWIPEVALLDIMMPGMHGYALCRKLKDDPRTRDTRVIILSAKGFKPDKDAAAKVGADAYLVKPIDFKALFSTIEGSAP